MIGIITSPNKYKYTCFYIFLVMIEYPKNSSVNNLLKEKSCLIELLEDIDWYRCKGSNLF